jgi:hypothetical protein
MSEAELYTKGAKIWIPDGRDVWAQASVVKWIHTYEDTRQLVVALQDGAVSINALGFAPLCPLSVLP